MRFTRDESGERAQPPIHASEAASEARRDEEGALDGALAVAWCAWFAFGASALAVWLWLSSIA